MMRPKRQNLLLLAVLAAGTVSLKVNLAQNSGPHAPADPSIRNDWPTYNGGVNGDHYSPLTQITTQQCRPSDTGVEL